MCKFAQIAPCNGSGVAPDRKTRSAPFHPTPSPETVGPFPPGQPRPYDQPPARLRPQAGNITGPILLSGAVHALGWVEGGPLRLLVDGMQLAVGLTLGVRFAGRSPRLVATAFGISVVATGVLTALAAAIAFTLPPMVGEGWQAVFLAFAPGGLAEMSLVALSLEVSAIHVTLHHIAPILIAVTVGQLLADRIIGR
jgi:uncharacterized membrane protein AbrB (regulator of aidB expression)